MSRKIIVGVILCVVLAAAAVAGAAEKVENVFIAGLDAGYYGHTGWLGQNFGGGIGGALFFGYGITRNFAIELDYQPIVTSSVKSSSAKQIYSNAYFGGLGQSFSGMGGIGASGKLYPRDRFRDADFVIVQPFARLGLGWEPFIWTYQKSVQPLLNYKKGDGFNNLYLNIGGGCDFMIVKWFSLGFDLRLWKYFPMTKTIDGFTTKGSSLYKVGSYDSSLTYSGGLNATFQW